MNRHKVRACSEWWRRWWRLLRAPRSRRSPRCSAASCAPSSPPSPCRSSPRPGPCSGCWGQTPRTWFWSGKEWKNELLTAFNIYFFLLPQEGIFFYCNSWNLDIFTDVSGQSCCITNDERDDLVWQLQQLFLTWHLRQDCRSQTFSLLCWGRKPWRISAVLTGEIMSLQYHREIFRSAMKIFSTYHSNGSFSTATKWNSSGPLFLRTESPVYLPYNTS